MLSKTEVQFEDPITRRCYVYSISKITQQLLTGKFKVVGGMRSQQTSGDVAPKFITSLESLPEKYRQELEFKLKVIKWINKNGISRGRREQINQQLNKFFEKNPTTNRKRPSTSTVMKWIREWDNSGCNPSSLVSKNFQRKRTSIVSLNIEDEIQKILRREYFIRSRPSLSRVYPIIKGRLQQMLSNSMINEKEAEISISSLRRRVQHVDPYVRDSLRYGATYAKNKWRYSLHGSYATRVLERLEVDHTILDVVVIADTNGMPLGRPIITIIVDSYSGYLVGFYISFSGAGLSSVLNCMKVSLMPKDIYTENADFLTNSWMGYGVGEMYVVDNGLEFHSPQFVNAAIELNTDIQYCPVRQPWFKPSVERYFREIGINLPSQGKVQKPEIGLQAIDPKKTARISFSELCKGLLKFVVDVHATKIHSRKLATPLELFQESFEICPPAQLPENLDSFGLIAAFQKSLTVGNEGIVLNYLRFNSRELQDLRRKVSHRFKTNVKFNPEDLGYCYVQNPKDLTWIYVQNCHPEYANGLSMQQHLGIRSHLKNRLIEGDRFEMHLRAKLEFVDMWKSFARGRKLASDAKTALLFGDLTSSKALQAPSNSLSSKTANELLAKNEMVANKVEIPVFSTYYMD